MIGHTLSFSTDNDFIRLQLISSELTEMLKREEKRVSARDVQLELLLDDVIDKINQYIDYEPSDEEMGGEPPMSASEIHSAAWKQHQELHS